MAKFFAINFNEIVMLADQLIEDRYAFSIFQAISVKRKVELALHFFLKFKRLDLKIGARDGGPQR